MPPAQSSVPLTFETVSLSCDREASVQDARSGNRNDVRPSGDQRVRAAARGSEQCKPGRPGWNPREHEIPKPQN